MSSSSESHDYSDLVDALEQKIAQLSRLRQENDDLRRKVERAEADNARLVRETLERAAKAAYDIPHYLAPNFSKTDEDGLYQPGSPYDRGRYDARKAIRSLASEDRT